MRFNVGIKLLTGFSIIILFTVLNAIASFYLLDKAQEIDKVFTDVIIPSEEYLKELKMKMSSSEKLSRNWFFQPREEEKKVLLEMHSTEFPYILAKLDILKESCVLKDTAEVNSSLRAVNEIITAQEILTETLSTEEDNSNPEKIDYAIMIIDRIISPNAPAIVGRLETVESDVLHMSDSIAKDKDKAYTTLKRSNLALTFLLFLVGGLSTLILSRKITRPLSSIQQVLDKMSDGELPEYESLKIKDELGDISKSVSKMIIALKSTVSFAKEIGQGNFESNYQKLSSRDELGEALIDMKNDLLKAKELEEIRTKEERELNWKNETVAKFATVLRNHDSFEELSKQFLSDVCKTLNAMAGTILIKSKKVLIQKAAYAHSSDINPNRTIEIGEGLAGECWKSGKMILLNNVEDSYLEINSGLGKQSALCLIFCPIRAQGETIGVLEMGSFSEMTTSQAELLEILCDNLGETVSRYMN